MTPQEHHIPGPESARSKLLECQGCGGEMSAKRLDGKPRKFCSHRCYVAFAAKRFERRQHTIPPLKPGFGSYREFLSLDRLPCVFEGCNWTGKLLALHVNQAHGITAKEFKRHCGFTLGTGIVAKPLATVLKMRARQGVALITGPGAHAEARAAAIDKWHNMKHRVVSPEGRETLRRVKAEITNAGPVRNCRGCGIDFIQSTIFGRAVYCTTECRDRHYAAAKAAKAKKRTRTRDSKGRFIWQDSAA